MFNDEQDIERELKAALDVRPSPGFEAVVRRRIQEERSFRAAALPVWPFDSLRSLRAGLPFGSLRSLRAGLLAAAAAVVLAMGAWYLAGLSTSEPVEEVRTVAAPDVRLPPPLAEPHAPPTVRPAARPRVRRSVPPTVRPADRQTRARAAAEPEVIVPPGQLAAIRRLVREVNAGRLMLPDAAAEPSAPAELAVPPVVVEPIPIVTLEPGGGSQPGAKGLQ